MANSTNTERAPYPHRGTVGRRGTTTYTHRIAIGASGAVSAQDSVTGVTATKQATAGQYLLQFPRSYRRIISIGATLIGAFGSTSTGTQVGFQTNQLEVNPVTGSGNSAGNIVMQWYTVANAAADVPSGSVLVFTCELEHGA